MLAPNTLELVGTLPLSVFVFVIQLASLTERQTKGSIQDRIAKAIEEEIPAIKDERERRRARKRARLEEEQAEKEGKVCRCGNKKFLGLVSRANDCNYWTLPSGKTGEGKSNKVVGKNIGERERGLYTVDLCVVCVVMCVCCNVCVWLGYMPGFPSITDSDGCMFDLCIECGVIYGFDKEALKAAIDHEEGLRDEDDNEDDDDDDDDEYKDDDKEDDKDDEEGH